MAANMIRIGREASQARSPSAQGLLERLLAKIVPSIDALVVNS